MSIERLLSLAGGGFAGQSSSPASRSLDGTGGASADAAASERAQIVTLAQEFEAYLLLQMLRQMRQSVLADEQEGGLGTSAMTDTVDLELGRSLSQTGGFGLARSLVGTLDRQLGTEASAGPDAVPAPTPTPQPAPSMQDMSGAQLPLHSVVTSPFGWRHDPLDGSMRFHRGIDLRAAYGQEVPSVGRGRVVVAGEQKGYGTTVVVEHAGGVQTRYAHLSSLQVSVGDEVEPGRALGRVGQTGRSTGPHLHFEVVVDGHPIDPVRDAGRVGGLLKNLDGIVDSSNDRLSSSAQRRGANDES